MNSSNFYEASECSLKRILRAASHDAQPEAPSICTSAVDRIRARVAGNSGGSASTTITGPAATTGTWYHVIAEYNASASTGTAFLCVNGILVGTDSFTSPWAGGSIQLSDGDYGGSQVDMTNAEIDDATLYNRVR